MDRCRWFAEGEYASFCFQRLLLASNTSVPAADQTTQRRDRYVQDPGLVLQLPPKRYKYKAKETTLARPSMASCSACPSTPNPIARVSAGRANDSQSG